MQLPLSIHRRHRQGSFALLKVQGDEIWDIEAMGSRIAVCSYGLSRTWFFSAKVYVVKITMVPHWCLFDGFLGESGRELGWLRQRVCLQLRMKREGE